MVATASRPASLSAERQSALRPRRPLIREEVPPRYTVLSHRGSHRAAKGLAGARQSRHHRPHRQLHHISELAVRQPFHITEHEHFPSAIGHMAHRARDQRGGIVMMHLPFRIERARQAAPVQYVGPDEMPYDWADDEE